MRPEINRIYQGDCLEVMRSWPAEFVDTVITDPPYGLEFMGKGWDKGVPGVEFWREFLRVTKPGGMALVFGGTRTFHRLACAIEDAGWELRDCMMWLYGSGFPKSLDISKAIDKAKGEKRRETEDYDRYHDGKKRAAQHSGKSMFDGRNGNTRTVPASDLAKLWNGWGTALKPAWEPIIVAMKPTDGTFAENAEKHGVAGLNIDGTRIEYASENDKRHNVEGLTRFNSTSGNSGVFMASKTIKPNLEATSKGRFPANLILDEEAGKMLDEQSGISKSTGGQASLGAFRNGDVYGKGRDEREKRDPGLGDSGGASRFFYCAKASRAERNRGCEGIPESGGDYRPNDPKENTIRQRLHGIKRPGNNHPTVKPLSLMRYLCRLTKTPAGGLVLDPFAGSGTTCIAAMEEGRQFLGIEKEAQYVKVAEARILSVTQQMKLSI